MPEGVEVIAFADDLAVVVVDKSPESIQEKASIAAETIESHLNTRRLLLAREKTEAVILAGPRKLPNLEIDVCGFKITPKKAMKYLGVWFGANGSFTKHVNEITTKARKTTMALSRIMPNIAGPNQESRKMLAAVARSQVLYASSVWENALNTKRDAEKVSAMDRILALRIIRAYKTVSGPAASAIANLPPLHLKAKERARIEKGMNKETARLILYQEWQTEWESESRGRWTYRLIPELGPWIKRNHGNVGYHLT